MSGYNEQVVRGETSQPCVVQVTVRNPPIQQTWVRRKGDCSPGRDRQHNYVHFIKNVKGKIAKAFDSESL